MLLGNLTQQTLCHDPVMLSKLAISLLQLQ